jgi:hypothetical protein
LACPYFIPTEVHERELWPHRERLPLGDGFAGRCGAHGGDQAANARCDDETLRLHCNLGYVNPGYVNPGYVNPGHVDDHVNADCAKRNAGCVHLPAGAAFDAVRFRVQRESREILRVQFACERAHQPAWCGELRYDQCLKMWLEPPDSRLLHLAEAAVRAWIAKNASPGNRSSR